MTRVLIDTSMWIEFFAKKPSVSALRLKILRDVINDGDAVIIEPIRAELLSGHILPRLRTDISLAMNALTKIDLDWNSRTVWDDVIRFADIAKNHKLAIPGVVDRMILVSALNAGAQVASCDKALLKLARIAEITNWAED